MSAVASAILNARPAPHFQDALATVLAETMAAADLLGRLHALQIIKQKTGRDLHMNTLIHFDDAPPKVLGFESVPFEQAIRRISNLTGYTRLAFDGLAQRYKLQAFTIAGTQDVRLIDSIRDELAKTLEQGGTITDWRKAVDALTQQSGAELFGRTQLETVFQTNVQTAYQNGKFEQMKDPAVTSVMPFWQYRTAGDSRVRPAHAALDGFTARHDDPVWRRLYPPTGYNCRCTVIPLSQDEAPDNAGDPGLDRIPAAAASVPDPGFGGMAA